jgi:hypothetical protein
MLNTDDLVELENLIHKTYMNEINYLPHITRQIPVSIPVHHIHTCGVGGCHEWLVMKYGTGQWRIVKVN